MSNPREYISTRVDLAELCKTARPSEIAQQGKEAGRERKSYQLTHGIYRGGSREDYAVLHKQTVGGEDF